MRGYPDLIEFKECNTVFAKNQPQYRPLPCYRLKDSVDGRIFFCWRLHWWDRIKILFTGKIWHQVMTFNEPLQPQLLMTKKPEMPK